MAFLNRSHFKSNIIFTLMAHNDELSNFWYSTVIYSTLADEHANHRGLRVGSKSGFVGMGRIITLSNERSSQHSAYSSIILFDR
jgi:hypothetical protein